MPLLLDTCTWLWLSSDLTRLPKKVQDALLENAGDLFMSAISAFEFTTKESTGKLQLRLNDAMLWFRKSLEQHGVTQVPINGQIAAHAGKLPQHHKDPFDRLIIATAWEYKMTVVTPDHLIRRYSEVECLW